MGNRMSAASHSKASRAAPAASSALRCAASASFALCFGLTIGRGRRACLKLRLAQVLVRRGGAPLLFSLAAGLGQGFDFLGQRCLLFRKLAQANSDFFKSPCARSRPGGEPDELRSRFGPRAGQAAETEAAVRCDPCFCIGRIGIGNRPHCPAGGRWLRRASAGPSALRRTSVALANPLASGGRATIWLSSQRAPPSAPIRVPLRV